MSQIVSPTGYKAIYREGDKKPYYRPVESWRSDGQPQVATERGLMTASHLDGYQGLTKCPQILGVVPGGNLVQDWCLAQEKDAPKAVWAIPVAAWIVTSDGEAQAVLPDSDESWPEKDYNDEEIDWDTYGMARVRTVQAADTTPGWREYRK